MTLALFALSLSLPQISHTIQQTYGGQRVSHPHREEPVLTTDTHRNTSIPSPGLEVATARHPS